MLLKLDSFEQLFDILMNLFEKYLIKNVFYDLNYKMFYNKS